MACLFDRLSFERRLRWDNRLGDAPVPAVFRSNARKIRERGLGVPKARKSRMQTRERRGRLAAAGRAKEMRGPFVERRRARRRQISRLAKVQLGAGTLPRDCLITDMSTGGVRLHVEGFEVPNDFVLILSGEGIAKECNYQVVWRLGHEVGARFVSLVRNRRLAARG